MAIIMEILKKNNKNLILKNFLYLKKNSRGSVCSFEMCHNIADFIEKVRISLTCKEASLL
jgi:hypothetical protein